MIVSQLYKIKRSVSVARPSGFTFLEVLIALCIVLIALVPLIQLHVTSIRLIDSSSRRARARLLADAKMAEIMAMVAPDRVRLNGRVEEGRGLVFHWRATVTDAELPNRVAAVVPGVRHVRVDVTWQEGRQDATVSANTFIHIPVRREQKETDSQHDLERGKAIAGRSRM